jgi:hypothetical protein
MKILVLIIACNQEPYISLKNTIQNTWNSIKHPNIEVLYLYSYNGITAYTPNSELVVNGDESYYGIGLKTLNAFKYCINNIEFDYIYRTNLSSYLHLKGLYEYTEHIPLNNIYRGAVGDHNGIKFASGCGYLISKDLVRYVVDHGHLWDHKSFLDDVSIAKVLQSSSIYPSPIDRIDIPNAHELNIFDYTKINDCFHFRCKSEIDRNHDIKAINMLHSYFNKV